MKQSSIITTLLAEVISRRYGSQITTDIKSLNIDNFETYISQLADKMVMGNLLLDKEVLFKNASDNLLAGVLNLTHPIGSVYMSVNSTNPGTLFGGTWQQVTDDAYLKIVTSDAGVLGGTASNHKIPTGSIPSHNHTFTGTEKTTTSAIGSTTINSNGRTSYLKLIEIAGDDDTSVSGTNDFTASVKSTGDTYAKGGTFPKNYKQIDISYTPRVDVNITDHQHKFTPSGTIGNTGSGNAYYPYYYGVYVWIRIA